jgi:hypothetical protein
MLVSNARVAALQMDSFAVSKNGFVAPNVMMDRFKFALQIKNGL